MEYPHPPSVGWPEKRGVRSALNRWFDFLPGQGRVTYLMKERVRAENAGCQVGGSCGYVLHVQVLTARSPDKAKITGYNVQKKQGYFCPRFEFNCLRIQYLRIFLSFVSSILSQFSFDASSRSNLAIFTACAEIVHENPHETLLTNRDKDVKRTILTSSSSCNSTIEPYR